MVCSYVMMCDYDDTMYDCVICRILLLLSLHSELFSSAEAVVFIEHYIHSPLVACKHSQVSQFNHSFGILRYSYHHLPEDNVLIQVNQSVYFVLLNYVNVVKSV